MLMNDLQTQKSRKCFKITQYIQHQYFGAFCLIKKISLAKFSQINCIVPVMGTRH